MKINHNFKIIKGDFLKDGYTILECKDIKEKIELVKNHFNKFSKLFGVDQQKNRNIIKRFAYSIEIQQIFSSENLKQIIRNQFNFEIPVFCGPVVSHFTSTNLMGRGFGLPYHQDWPSMASCKKSLIVWFCLSDCDSKTHSIAVLEGLHKQGLLKGNQKENGYEIDLTCENLKQEKILKIKAGELLFMSSFLPHKTFVNNESTISKVSLSRRIDDLSSTEWGEHKFVNAYNNSIDRELYLS